MNCAAECRSYIHSAIVGNSGKTSINQAAINIRIIDTEPEKMIVSQMTDIAAMIRVATNCLIIFGLSCPGSTAMLTFAHNKQCCEYTDAAQRQEHPACS